MCVCVYKRDRFWCLHILYPIRSCLCISRLNSDWNDYRKATIFSQVFSASNGVIYELCKTMTSHICLCKE